MAVLTVFDGCRLVCKGTLYPCQLVTDHQNLLVLYDKKAAKLISSALVGIFALFGLYNHILPREIEWESG